MNNSLRSKFFGTISSSIGSWRPNLWTAYAELGNPE